MASLLAEFYKRAAPVKISPEEYIHRLEGQVRSTFQELRGPDSFLPVAEVDAAERFLLDFTALRFELLHERASEERIVEGHGDLRQEHVCLRNPPCIIDCLEFSRDLRSLDSCEELAFLARKHGADCL